MKKKYENNLDTEKSSNGVLSVKNLTKRFGTNVVLDNISLTIEDGKTTVIIGPSGCGKTVLVKHLIALLRPNSGEVYFKKHRIDNLSENELNNIRTHYGFLFQGGALFDSLNVTENIIFPIRQHCKITDWKEVEELVKSKLAMVGLDGFQQFYPSNLSGGQQKRVALARAIALNPEIILYDEPTTGLDPIRSDVINELVLKLQKELGVTSVVVTHDMNSAYKIADRIIMLHNGKIIADGNADHIRNHPHPVVQQFISGQVSEEDLAVLRMRGNISHTQFLPRDFE
ncbi:MAG: ABC transporter ATP-binding protein [Planctomycetes bacterium]|nr:ABC transporter ATP-binding protein [Planctomycetota bacterium]MBL7145890.1 ABC transporter ATP-binding protein [Phycisphaerae bacterium]